MRRCLFSFSQSFCHLTVSLHIFMSKKFDLKHQMLLHVGIFLLQFLFLYYSSTDSMNAVVLLVLHHY